MSIFFNMIYLNLLVFRDHLLQFVHLLMLFNYLLIFCDVVSFGAGLK